MKNLKTVLLRHGGGILICVFAMVCFCFFQGWYRYHFFYQEQNQLFLSTPVWLATYFDKPAWLACMLGDWLMQFYYYLYAGPAILATALLLVGMSVYGAVGEAGLKGRCVKTVLAIAAMAVESLFSLDYGFRLCSVLAVAGGAVGYIFYRNLLKVVSFLLTHHSLKTRSTSGMQWWYYGADCVLVASVALLVFWLFGYGMAVFFALVLAGSLLQAERWQILLYVVFLALPLCLIPLGKRWWMLDVEALFSWPGTGKFVKPQMEYEKIFGVDAEYRFGNYNKVVRMVEGDAAPDQYSLFYYDLVMAQRGQLADNLLRFRSNNLGTLEAIGPGTPSLTLQFLAELYWLLGDMTFAERATMLACVGSPDTRNIRMVKRLAEINIVNGDWEAARKYLRVLQHTWVCGPWASDMLQAVGRVQTALSPKLKEYLQKPVNKTDTLRLDDNAYVIMHELLESNAGNRIALDYLLCSDLLLKDMDTFKRDYDRFYLQQNSQLRNVKLYQEALMVYLAGTGAPPEEWQKYISRTDILQRFGQYNRQRGSEAFRDTYWYYFDKTPSMAQNSTNRTQNR